MTDKQNEVGLLPCPFCGKEPAIEKYCIGTRIVCLAKNISGIINHCVYVDGVTESEARASWNRYAENETKARLAGTRIGQNTQTLFEKGE